MNRAVERCRINRKPSTVRPWARGFCPHGRPGPLGFGLCGRLPRHGVGGFVFNSPSSSQSQSRSGGCGSGASFRLGGWVTDIDNHYQTAPRRGVWWARARARSTPRAPRPPYCRCPGGLDKRRICASSHEATIERERPCLRVATCEPNG